MIQKLGTYEPLLLDRQIELLCRVITPQHGVASPVGVNTPRFLGDRYIDTVAKTAYTAMGMSSADWALG